MNRYLKSCMITTFTHGLGLLGLIITNEIALKIYLAWNGDFDSRGIAPGAVTRLVLLLFTVLNLTIAITPIKSIKLGGCAAFIVLTAWILLPSHPLRTIFYCTTGGLITLCSIYFAAHLNRIAIKST